MNHMKIGVLLRTLLGVWMSVTVSVLEGVGSEPKKEADDGKRWALLVAGSEGYENYRHQADVCHAYQIMKKGGLKDENIIVFMADDIAFNDQNPRPGVIINKPFGPNVYQAVPKDYTGIEANVENLFAVISGNRSGLSGGSGKVLKSGPNDIIFIYYVDHGSPGIVGMPNGGIVTSKDLVDALKKKHEAKSYKKMVIYMEACESGSMFEGLLPSNINIYATTASNGNENSYAFYCPDFYPSSPPDYTTCLGDTYSISWLEDSDKNDMTRETLHQQYETVRRRTLVGSLNTSSHVMQYGDTTFKNDFLSTYFGAADLNSHIAPNANDSCELSSSTDVISPTRLVSQRDARLLHLKYKLKIAPYGSNEKLQAQKELDAEMASRMHVDNTFHLLGNLLFGEDDSSSMMLNVRPPGQPLVDDWDCFKTLLRTYENHCGMFSSYGMKYSRAFANMCNAGISEERIVAALSQACHNKKNHAF